MKFCVYMILSKKGDRFFSYVGYTSNIDKRLLLHNNSKGAKYTKGKKWEVIYTKYYSSKSIALKEEYKLKKDYKLRKKLKNIYLDNVKI